jgi:hypothetical protein
MDRRQDGTAAALFAADPVPAPGEAVAPRQDARLRQGRSGGTPPATRRPRPFRGSGRRPVRRSATRDPRAAAPRTTDPAPSRLRRPTRGRARNATTEILTR